MIPSVTADLWSLNGSRNEDKNHIRIREGKGRENLVMCFYHGDPKPVLHCLFLHEALWQDRVFDRVVEHKLSEVSFVFY